VRRAGIDRLFFRSEQIDQKRRQIRFVEHRCDMAIARAVPAAPATVGEEHDTASMFRQVQVALECQRSDWDCDQSLIDCRSYILGH
jgi:hypothetical protein